MLQYPQILLIFNVFGHLGNFSTRSAKQREKNSTGVLTLAKSTEDVTHLYTL